jgi:hypothetical protein
LKIALLIEDCVALGSAIRNPHCTRQSAMQSAIGNLQFNLRSANLQSQLAIGNSRRS